MQKLTGLRGNTRFWLKSYLFIGVVILIVGVLVYTNRTVNRMEQQSEATTRLFSRFIAEVVFQVGTDTGKFDVVQQVLEEIRLPIVLTDVAGRPFAWHRIGFPQPADEEFALLQQVDPKNPPNQRIRKIIETVERLDRDNDPIPINIGNPPATVAYIHFGNSQLQRELRLMPAILLALFLVFMGVAFQGFRYLKLSEQRSIWVGMAKETAHQLGTPLSALLGWIQILRDQVNEKAPPDKIETSLREMEDDLARLNKVTERFSKIGSQPELKNTTLTPILERTVAYFHQRLPRLKANSVLKTDFDETPLIRGNEQLLEWVFENLVKNALDALGEAGGEISITTRFNSDARMVEVTVADTGKGVPPAMRKRIFSPGFTTKKRGWGLGLALVQRIVRDYHGGDIRLTWSQPGRGSTFVARFPAI